MNATDAEDHHYVWTHVGGLHAEQGAAEAEMLAWLRRQDATVEFAKVYQWRAAGKSAVEPGSQPAEQAESVPTPG